MAKRSDNRTVVSLCLAQQGEMLVSRAEAKRIAAQFERFSEVVLDFDGVDTIGQGFADELFRVFAGRHPDVRLKPINTSPEVAKMIRRVVSGRMASK